MMRYGMMVTKISKNELPQANFHIDITDQVCPLTFVRTKLLIESIAVGEIAEVRLKGSEPLTNVPKSVEQHGHIVLALIPEKTEDLENDVYRLIIQKN